MESHLRASRIALVVLLSASAAFAEELRDQAASDVSNMNLRFHLATESPAAPSSVGLSLLSASRYADRGFQPGSVKFGLRRTEWTAFPRGLQAYELSRADCALKGLGAGASLGLWLGALAKTTGAWDEQTSWWVAGASAAAGALMGGTVGVSSEAWRTHYQWDE